jgi:hypothetical protein
MSRLHMWDVHPALFALYPLVNLYVNNADIVSFPEIIRYVLVIIAAVLLINFALNRLLKHKPLASLSTALIALMIFYVPFPFAVIIHQTQIIIVLTIAWISLFCLVGLLFLRLYARRRPRAFLNGVNGYLNYLTVAVFCVVLFNLFTRLSRFDNPVIEDRDPTAGVPQNASISLPVKPDVYYIILDGYGRQDVLQQYYNFDNSGYLQNLRDMGFYVADESTSNYSQTRLSLPSSLNMEYIEQMFAVTSNTPTSAIENLLDQNRVMRLFHEQGYEVVNFSAGFEMTDSLSQADINYSFGPFGDFAVAYFRTTMLSVFPIDELANRERIVRTLEAMPALADQDQPTFAFAHILAPHPPFWFNADGSPADMSARGAYTLNGWTPLERYSNQIIYLNHLVEVAMSSILERSETPPIIIIQGDHGPASDWHAMQERMPILNVYYLPEEGSQYLYPSITPVNSFRLIFDIYFGKHFGLLADHAYLSHPETPLNLCEYDQTVTPLNEADQVIAFLESHAYRIRVDDCGFEHILPFRDGLYTITPEADAAYRLAEQVVHLQLPVMGQQDYVFSASVEHIVSPEAQQIDITVGGEHLGTTHIAPGKSEFTFTVPAELVRNEPFVLVTLEHTLMGQSLVRGFPIPVSLKYYAIGWQPS